MSSTNETSFSIDITAASGDKYVGTFRVSRRLNHLQRLALDERRRVLLGNNPLGATDEVLMSSLIIATCQAHVLSGPGWWEKSNKGLDLFDPEPLQEIYNQIKGLQESDQKALLDKAEKAAAELKG